MVTFLFSVEIYSLGQSVYWTQIQSSESIFLTLAFFLLLTPTNFFRFVFNLRDFIYLQLFFLLQIGKQEIGLLEFSFHLQKSSKRFSFALFFLLFEYAFCLYLFLNLFSLVLDFGLFEVCQTFLDHHAHLDANFWVFLQKLNEVILGPNGQIFFVVISIPSIWLDEIVDIWDIWAGVSKEKIGIDVIRVPLARSKIEHIENDIFKKRNLQKTQFISGQIYLRIFICRFKIEFWIFNLIFL